MRKIVLPQNSLATGEIAPNSFAREDITLYGSAVKELQNWALLLEGGVERRAGAEFIATLQGEARLGSFEFNEAQKYVFVFTNLRLDIWSVDDSNPDILPVVTFVETVTTNADWTTALLDTLRSTHSGDTMFLADGTGAQIMKKIVRTSATTFTISDFAFEQNSAGFPLYQPYFKFAEESITITPSATTGTITLTTSAAHWDAGGLHNGIIVRVAGKECLTTTVSSTTVMNAAVRETLAGTSAVTDWDEAVFSAANGYQLEVSLAENRLHIAGSRDFPHGNWFSNSNAFFKFEEGDGDDDQFIDRPIDSGKIEVIRGVNVNDHIEVYTDQAEHYFPLSETQVFAPTTASLRTQEKNGINGKVPPITYDGATVFVQRTGMVLREFLFNSSDDKFNSLPISLLATHLFQKIVNGKEFPADIRRSTVLNGTTRRPESYWFTVNVGQGSIIGFHSLREEKIAGFMHWTTEGLWTDCQAVGNQLFYVSKRTVAGDVWDASFSDDFGRDTTVYHLERAEPSFTLDFAAKVTRAIPGKLFVGLTHLANRTVHIVSRSAIYHGTFAVNSAGEVTLDEDETEIVAGLDYNVVLKTLRPRFAVQGFTITGSIKRAINIVINMSQGFSLRVGGVNKMLIRKVNDDLSLDPTAVVGQREFGLRGYSREAEVELTQDEPLPVRILGYQMTIGV